MTPAITLAKQKNLTYTLHEYAHDSNNESYGLEACDKLGVPAEQVFKTLVVADDRGKLAVAVLPVNNTLNFKKMATALKAKKVSMAQPKLVEKTTGYVLGGVSPLGQKRQLPTIIDISANHQKSIFVSAGKRGLEIELPPNQLSELVSATFVDIVNG